MIFELAKDFADALEARRLCRDSAGIPPAEDPKWKMVDLLNDAIRRDIYFIAKHRVGYPQALFQCVWNHGWWYDCPDAAKHYEVPKGGWKQPPPWDRPGPKLCALLERWRGEKETRAPGFHWLRSRRPPPVPLGSALKAVLRGHESFVKSVVFSPDGRRIASGSDDKTVRLWDAESGAEVAVMRGHKDHVTSVAFSPDGRRIASRSDDKTVRLWEAVSGAEIAVLHGHKDHVTSVAFSPDGRRIASRSDDKTVHLCGDELDVLRGYESRYVASVAFSPDGRRIASGSYDTVRLWDARSGQCVQVIQGTGDVSAIVAGPALYSCWALCRGDETVVERAEPPGILARFPAGLHEIVTHPNARSWAGGVANHLYVITLEGEL